MTKRNIIICRDADELNRNAAERFVLLANEAAAETGRFTVALSGGSTPKALYSLLASAVYNECVPWSQVHLFWCDERCVPPNHPDSNYRMAREALLSRIVVPADNVHRIAGEKEPQLAASEYEDQLKGFFHLTEGSLPQFDLILLGLGEDGHTASLFPEDEALEETERLVVAVYVERLKAHRLTLTLPVLNQGARIFFLVAGASRAAILQEALGAKIASSLPAAKVQPIDGELTWLITQEAAAHICP